MMNALARVSGEPQVRTEVPRMREEPRFQDALDLVALPTAVAVARMFIEDTLRRWHALFIEDHMGVLATELVSLAVEATGPASGTNWTDITALNPIRLRMLGYQRTIVFEVTDVHPEPLVVAEDEELPQDHGLVLIDALASRWGSFLAPQGRVIWAELPVYERTAANLPLRPPAPTFDPPPSRHAWSSRHSVDFLRRVHDGLERL